MRRLFEDGHVVWITGEEEENAHIRELISDALEEIPPSMGTPMFPCVMLPIIEDDDEGGEP